jgi:hypothetical protein
MEYKITCQLPGHLLKLPMSGLQLQEEGPGKLEAVILFTEDIDSKADTIR